MSNGEPQDDRGSVRGLAPSRLRLAALATLAAAVGLSGCANPDPHEVTVDLESDDGSCEGTATFETPDGWKRGDEHTLLNPDLGITVSGLCRTQEFAKTKLDYTGAWALDDVDEWLATGSRTTPRDFTIDGQPARYRHGTVDLAETIEVVAVTAFVDDTAVVLTADIQNAADYRRVARELDSVLERTRLEVSG